VAAARKEPAQSFPIVGAYIISRGLSKLGSGEPRVEEHENDTIR